MKRIISIILAVCIIFALYIPVSAAGMANFLRYNVYNNNFTDVASTNWAAPSIRACYEYALMYGSSDTKFNPNGNLTIAEALVMADRVHSIYNTGNTAVFSGGNPWYKPYVDYAVNNGIVSASDFKDVTQKITRAQMAYVFYNALPEKEFTVINSIRNIPDVNNEHKFHTQIKALYNAGILTGSDSFGTFHPENNITRAEAAAIISRVADTSLRKSFSILEPLTADETKDKCSPAVAFIEAYNGNDIVATGNGFFISKDGLFVTVTDIIKDATHAKIRTVDGKSYTVNNVYDCDMENNLVLIKAEGENFSYLETDTSAVKTGDSVYALYSIKGNKPIVSGGTVSNPSYSYYGQNFIECNISVPSSSIGAVIVNNYGKVTGIKQQASTVLAIPVQYAVDLNAGNPMSMENFSQFLETEPVLYTAKNNITVSQGVAAQSILVNFSPALRDHITITTDVSDIVEITEIKYISDHEILLTFKGLNIGRTTVCISYTFEPVSDKKLNIKVTTGAPESEPAYYGVGAPSYSSITGIPCEYSYIKETDTTYNYYEDGAAIYGYDYYAPSEPDSYMKALKANGWAYSETDREGDVVANFFIKGNYRIGVNVDYGTNTVYIVFYTKELSNYKNGAPTYHDVTGVSCLSSYFKKTDRYLDGYYEDADIFDYRYTSEDDLVNYMTQLKNAGWVYHGYEELETSALFIFGQGENLIGVEVDFEQYIVTVYVA